MCNANVHYNCHWVSKEWSIINNMKLRQTSSFSQDGSWFLGQKDLAPRQPTQTLMQRLRCPSKRVNRPEPEVNHSSRSNAEVKKDYIYIYSTICLHCAKRNTFYLFTLFTHSEVYVERHYYLLSKMQDVGKGLYRTAEVLWMWAKLFCFSHSYTSLSQDSSVR